MDEHKVISYTVKHFDAINFTNGYSKNSPSLLIECHGIFIVSGGLPKWGAIPNQKTFVLKLGKILSTKNINQ